MYWFSVFLVSCLAVAGAQAATTLHVSTFGAKADDGVDDTAAVRAAIQAVKKAGAGVTLLFDKGCYDFFPNKAEERYLFVSNNDEGLKRIAFALEGLKDVTIDGRGARFLFRGWMTPFSISQCDQVTLKNFSMDWTRTFHSEGVIVENHADGVTVQIPPHFPYDIRNGVLVFTDGQLNTEPQTTVKGSELVYRYGSLLEFDVQRRETAYMVPDYYGLQNGIAAKDLGERKVRLFKDKLKGTVGNVFVFSPNHRDCCGFVLSDTQGTTLCDLTIYHAGGMGILGQRSRDIVVERVQVTPGKSRIVSTTADATHFANCSGKLVLKDCLFENQKDDATNVHGIYVRVMGRTAQGIEIKLVHPQQHGFHYLTPGMKIELVHGKSLITYATATVKAVTVLNKEYAEVTVNEPLPAELEAGDVIAELDNYPETLISGCTIRNNRARGILLGSRARMVIEKNTFHTPGAAILLEGDGCFWFEQAGVRDLVIRDNLFDTCNFGVWGRATIETGAGPDKSCRATSRYNRNIVIENNTFKTFGIGAPLVQMYCAQNVTIRKNTIMTSEAYPAKKGDASTPYCFTDSDTIQIEP